MRHAILLMALVLMACSPSTVYYREGAPVAEVDRALARCSAEAAAALPVRLETRYTSLQVRRLRVCDAAGNCELEIETEGGEPYEVDLNVAARDDRVRQCMAIQRLVPVTLPACPPGVARAAPAGPTTALPRLTPQSCAVQRDDGLRIVTRG